MEPFPNTSPCNYDPVSGRCMNHHMSHEEMVQYLENLKVKIDECSRKDRAIWDKGFFELRLNIYLLFDLLRRRIDRLEARMGKDPNPIEVSLPYWALN
jgi:hypothetical protein